MPPEELYEMEYEQTSKEGEPVVYLGMQLSINKADNTIRMQEFDKEKIYPFTIFRYPHKDSNVPAHQAEGVYYLLTVNKAERNYK